MGAEAPVGAAVGRVCGFMLIGPETSDAELVAACRRGREDAWAALVARYQRLVFTVAHSHRLNPADGAEVFDAVFTEFWRALPRIEHPDQVRAWLVTVTRRHCLAHWRHQRRWVSLSDPDTAAADPPDPTPVGDAVLLEAEREHAMRTALDQLPTRCRRLLEWLFFTDPPPAYQEIGRRLGLAPNSIGFIRSRCLRKLRDAFEAQMTEPDNRGRAAGGDTG